MYEKDVFEVTLYDRKGNEVGFRKIATFDRTSDFLADEALREGGASKATVRGQHYQYGEVDLDQLHDRLVIEGYIY